MSEAGSGNLYEAMLAGLASAAGTAATAMPSARSSASVVPWRRTLRTRRTAEIRRAGGPSGVEVFWVKRGETLPFMGGWHAFPGGGLARSDAEIPVIPPAAPAEPAPPARPQPAAADDLPTGILACAIRELFEETGILLARPAPGTEGTPDPAQIAEARRALLGGRSFATVLRDLGSVADASRLVYAGRWLTPPFAPLRFDNRFFLLEWPAAEAAQPEVQPGELEAGAWVEPAAAWQSWHLGDVLAKRGEVHKALDLYREALTFEPDAKDEAKLRLKIAELERLQAAAQR